MRIRALAAVFLVALIAQAPAANATRSKSPAILLAAGDIGDCSLDGAALTARLIERQPGTVAAIGDTAYPNGTISDFERCYAPYWGRFRSRTRPALGNHEYGTGNADAYFAYFGKRAAAPGGYYSYKLGTWHIVVLNSNCSFVGCGPGSPQLRWLRADLAAHRTRCTLAYWHHPRFSEGPDTAARPDEALATQPFWAALAKAGAEIVLTGHDHLYERFAPLDAAGRQDPKRGLREFVVGTGGRPHYPVVTHVAGNQKVVTGRWGVLRLQLSAKGYRWQFLSTPNSTTLDSGVGSCH
ncbi:MAG: metallophosphoesterase [Gaiellaceae bacterium]